MKKILSELYEGLTTDLGDDLSKFDGAIKKRLKGIVDSYGQYNNVDDEGSLKSTQNSLQNLLNATKKLFKPNGLLTEESLKKMKGPSVDPVKEKEREQELEKLRKENEKLKKANKSALSGFEKTNKELEQKNIQLSNEANSLRASILKQKEEFNALQQKQNELLSGRSGLEEKLKKEIQSKDAAERKMKELEVFELNLTEMRKMWESEVDEKKKYMNALKDLSSVQKKLKITWVPSESQQGCLLCKESFSMFGSKSKHYCRYCGRLYCKACTKEVPIPELGFTDKTRICNACFNFKNGRPLEQSDNNINDAVVSYDDDDTKSIPPTSNKNQTSQQVRPSSSSPSTPGPGGKGSGPGTNTGATPVSKGNTSTPNTGGKGGKKTNDSTSNKNAKKQGLGFLDDDDGGDIGDWGAPSGKGKDEEDEDEES